MQYQTVFYTEYQIRYVNIKGKDDTSFTTFKRKKSAQNWIDKANKPSFIDHYYIQEVQVTHQKLINL